MTEGGIGTAAAAAEDPFYIRALSARVDIRTRVLKHGESFAVFDRYGDIVQLGLGELGLYHAGTRFLSHLELRLGGERPLFLSSTVSNDNLVLAVDLTNHDLSADSDILVPRGTVHLTLRRVLRDGVCHERLRIVSYGTRPVRLPLAYHFAADYADIFEVRGIERARRGSLLPAALGPASAVLAYEGLDRVLRRTRLEWDVAPHELTTALARYAVRLEPHRETILHLRITCEAGEGAGCGAQELPDGARGVVPGLAAPAGPGDGAGAGRPGASTRASGFSDVLAQAEAELLEMRRGHAALSASNPQIDQWLQRSLADLHLMTTRTEHGPYPYAGVPWFSTVFGRDGILTALSCLWFHPGLARGVLRYLAATQARAGDPEHDAQPGKIVHEIRGGEMAALGEIPFGRYYGSVDATPLFVLLAGEHFRRTGDVAFARELWPSIELALRWMDTDGDPDADGFLEYARHTPEGLLHQGWKDSADAVFHADGRLAEPPIALCEVQAYAYAARLHAAEMARTLGDAARADALQGAAETLAERFREAFWDAELHTFALALDGEKRPCRVRTSNAGHCLLSGIATQEQARGVERALFTPAGFSGWGVRTVATTEARYNPMSYHNGSVWPHDNAVVAAGLARYDLKRGALAIFDGLAEAGRIVDLHRLPELVCGFERRSGEGPTLYPVACAPQAWASAAPFLVIQACLGLSLDASAGRIVLSHPVLPPALEQLRIDRLQLGEGEVELVLRRQARDVAVEVVRQTGGVEVVTRK